MTSKLRVLGDGRTGGVVTAGVAVVAACPSTRRSIEQSTGRHHLVATSQDASSDDRIQHSPASCCVDRPTGYCMVMMNINGTHFANALDALVYR